MHFLEKVYIPFVVSASVGQTLQKTVDYPQLQFLDKVFIPVVVVSGADGQTLQKTVEYPQLQFLDKTQTMLSRSLVGAKMQVKVGIGSCAILGENIETS